jgi:hypothetical protein
MVPLNKGLEEIVINDNFLALFANLVFHENNLAVDIFVDPVEAKDCKYKLLTEGSTGFQ